MDLEPNPNRLTYEALTPGLPAHIYLGACSWTHEFWKGQIYHRSYSSAKDFNLNSLAEYASFGIFRLVEIDSSFYAPPKEETLQKYAEIVPADFKFTAKVWERLSIPVFPLMKRYGKLAGEVNPDFLNPQLFLEKFLPPFRNPHFFPKLAALLIQFPKMDSTFADSKAFLTKLEIFLKAIPRDIPLAIESRNTGLLNTAYFNLLNTYKISHCFNHWQSMPPLIDQMKAMATAGGSAADFYLARLLTPLGMSFETAGEFFKPFHEIKRKETAAREDVIRLAKRATQKSTPAYILVNNRFEGNTPLSILELEQTLLKELR